MKSRPGCMKPSPGRSKRRPEQPAKGLRPSHRAARHRTSPAARSNPPHGAARHRPSPAAWSRTPPLPDHPRAARNRRPGPADEPRHRRHAAHRPVVLRPLPPSPQALFCHRLICGTPSADPGAIPPPTAGRSARLRQRGAAVKQKRRPVRNRRGEPLTCDPGRDRNGRGRRTAPATRRGAVSTARQSPRCPPDRRCCASRRGRSPGRTTPKRRYRCRSG